MQLTIKSHKVLFRFILPMAMTMLLCITSPVFARIPTTDSSPVSTAKNQQSVLSIEKKAKRLYSQGKFSEAAQLFQQAALTNSDPIRQALNLSNLSLCWQQLGQWENANRVITQSIALLNINKDKNTERLLALAQSFDIQGGLQLMQGKANAALKSWENTTAIYAQLNQPQKILTSQTKQAQALQNLGLYRRTIPLLEKALNLSEATTVKEKEKEEQLKTQLEKISDSPETTTALRILGKSLYVVGNFTQANVVLEHSLSIANKLKLPDAIALAQISLGNIARAQINSDNSKDEKYTISDRNQVTPETAIKFYEQAAKSNYGNIRVQAQLNQLNLLTNQELSLLNNPKYQDIAKTLLLQVKADIQTLPPIRHTIEARVNLAQSMMEMREKIPKLISYKEIAQILAVGIQQAKDLKNPQMLSYSLGTLGKVYEQAKRWTEAQKLTQQALQLAQQINAQEIAYLWQWQLGRITKAQGNKKNAMFQRNRLAAIAAYKEAVKTIKSLRTELAAANPDVQFSFKNAVEPIHRELVSLLVESNQQDNLKTARDVIEGLQLVELENFFRQACLNAKPEQIDNIGQQVAVIYPIILKDQLAIITSLPKLDTNSQKKYQKNQEEKRDFRYYKIKINSHEIEKIVKGLQDEIQQTNIPDLTLPKLEKLYNLIIRPEASELAQRKVKTLVFVLDGVLRNIPISALYDGEQKQYLVENYNIALTPGLQLLSPRSLQKQRLGAFVGGLSQARQGYPPLPNIKQEVEAIKSNKQLRSQVLFNQNFQTKTFKNKVSRVDFSIIHLATHGQFSSNADDTYVITWDGKIKVNQLSSVLKTVELSQENSLELLVLSACQTASGDERSALGLAGVAVRSGARSTIATLWLVNDQASATLMKEFYKQLVEAKETGKSKAEALRLAQLSILKSKDYSAPYYWAAYVLLGNWT